jgi:tetratricopeptide (TPR) repeat protein
MAEFEDYYGLPLTSGSQAAVAPYVEGIEALLMGNAGGPQALRRAIEIDGGFGLAHAALALTLQAAGRDADAADEVDQALRLVSGCSARERGHVETIAAIVAGDVSRGLSLIEQHLAEFPRDALPLSRTHFLLNQSGRPDRKERSFRFYDRCAAAFGDDAWFLSLYSFQHNELYHFDEARSLAERSLDLNQRNCWCAHAMSHVFFETGEHGAGESFLDGWLDGSPWQTGQAGHLGWHLALFELGTGNIERAAAIYEETLKPSSYPGNVARGRLVDPASLLWRYRLYGIEPPAGAAEDVLESAQVAFPLPGQAFIDVHKAMALALSGDQAGCEALARDQLALIEAGRQPAGPVTAAIVRSIAAFANQDYRRSVELLEPYAGEIGRVGGSRAQYEVFQDTLIAACIRGGMPERAEPVLRERLARRASRQDEVWLREVEGLKPETSVN